MEYLGCICALSACQHKMQNVPACLHVATLVINDVPML